MGSRTQCRVSLVSAQIFLRRNCVDCDLENSLIKAPILGELQRPLSALVFHFGQYTSRSSFRPCEASFLAYRHPDFREHTGVSSVHILVAPSNYHNLNESYSQIPGVKVRPFKLRSKDLNISSMLNLMSVDQTDMPPLYVGQITRILRDIATASAGEFDYQMFKAALATCDLMRGQKVPLQQRLDLLESFLETDDSAVDYNFEAGSITIVDLSCPFIDANTACVLFNICIDIYLGSHPTVGKILAIDEAHKVCLSRLFGSLPWCVLELLNRYLDCIVYDEHTSFQGLDRVTPHSCTATTSLWSKSHYIDTRTHYLSASHGPLLHNHHSSFLEPRMV